MISGFNTDIEFGGTVYHVQTEDKGLSKRIIMSLVYDGGTILASKRVSYDDLAAGNFDKKKLSERIGRQHKLICAAVRAGRLDELKEMTAKSATVKAKAESEAVVEDGIPIVSLPLARIETALISASAPSSFVETPQPLTVMVVDQFADEPVVEGVQIIEDNEILAADAVQVVSELSGQGRPSNTKLSIKLLGDTKFKGGMRRTVNIMICRGTGRKVVDDAQIMIKVLGSSFRPVIFHAKSDTNGLAKVHLQLPHFQAGRVALLVRAMTDGEEIELRRIVTPG